MRSLVLAGLVATLTACQPSGSTAAATSTAPPPPMNRTDVRGEKPATLDQFPELTATAITISEKGFEPATIPAKKGDKIALVFTRTAEHTCATEVVFDDLGGLEAKLPLNQPVRISFTVPKSGDVWFGCGMQRMVRGKILATDG